MIKRWKYLFTFSVLFLCQYHAYAMDYEEKKGYSSPKRKAERITYPQESKKTKSNNSSLEKPQIIKLEKSKSLPIKINTLNVKKRNFYMTNTTAAEKNEQLQRNSQFHDKPIYSDDKKINEDPIYGSYIGKPIKEVTFSQNSRVGRELNGGLIYKVSFSNSTLHNDQQISSEKDKIQLSSQLKPNEEKKR